MNIRDRIECFWRGERPDRIPLTMFYWCWMTDKDDPGWQSLFDAGLGIVFHLQSWRTRTPGLEIKSTTYTDERHRRITRHTYHTPVGEMHETHVGGWHDTYLLKTAEDYRVMTWIAEHTLVEPAHDEWRREAEGLKPWGIPLVHAGRSPIQYIIVDHAGLERFAMHLVDFPDEVRTLWAALRRVCEERWRIVAEGPGRYVAMLENFTAETLGPARYEEFISPVYARSFPMLKQAGKIIGCHYDGQVKSCAQPINAAPFDIIESLTGPPDGDTTPAEARQLFPTKRFWHNINVSNYQLPPDQLAQLVRDTVARGAPDGRRLAIEVSEDLPRNWKQSLPVVLDTLNAIEV